MAAAAQAMDARDPAFGTFRAPWLFRRLVGADDLGQPHPVSGLRKSLSKRYLRWTARQFDVNYRGFRLRLTPVENADDRTIVMTGVHPEEDEFAVFEEIAPRHDCFVDIGANIGLYSLMAKRLMPAGARIIAFEPAPATLEKLRRHLDLNAAMDAITVIPAGVGPAAGHLRLNQVNAKNAGQNSMRLEGKDSDGIEVQVVTLVDALAEQGVDKVGVLKIDIEGFEDQALVPFFETAPDTLWPAYLMLETCHRARWDNDLVTVLETRGYQKAFENKNNMHFHLDRGRAGS